MVTDEYYAVKLRLSRLLTTHMKNMLPIQNCSIAASSMMLNLLLSLLLAPPFAIILVSQAALAADKPDYFELAQQQFDKDQFQSAAESSRLAIYSKNNSPAVWLLLARSYQKMGEITASRQTYECVCKHFPNSPEKAIAATELAKLPKIAAIKPNNQLAQPHSSSSKPTESAQPVASPLKDRVYVVPPRFAHAPVSASTVTLVKEVVASVPEQIYKILDQGQVKVFVTPNLIDKFPDAIHATHPTLGTYFSAEFGRAYDRDVYVCERLGAEPGGTELQPPMIPQLIKATTYTMLAHALNSCLELPSSDEQFLRLHRQDIADYDGADNDLLKLYVQNNQSGASETFAGLASSIMGNDCTLTHKLDRAFPRSRAWIQARVSILAKQKGL